MKINNNKIVTVVGVAMLNSTQGKTKFLISGTFQMNTFEDSIWRRRKQKWR
ncbi:hypothetical protein L8106_07339 [Lyngbya sp. PCC 8106]|nr:hypothetical protein L8106_07339 [Lyngbya sp. PCC 8106]